MSQNHRSISILILFVTNFIFRSQTDLFCRQAESVVFLGLLIEFMDKPAELGWFCG